MSFEECKAWVTGDGRYITGDCFSVSQTLAYNMAKAVNGLVPRGPEISDGSGKTYLWHYHPKLAKYDQQHCFY